MCWGSESSRQSIKWLKCTHRACTYAIVCMCVWNKQPHELVGDLPNCRHNKNDTTQAKRLKNICVNLHYIEKGATFKRRDAIASHTAVFVFSITRFDTSRIGTHASLSLDTFIKHKGDDEFLVPLLQRALIITLCYANK